MSLGSEQNYMDKLKAKNTAPALRQQQEAPPVPMVQISAEDWEKLQALLKEMRLTSGQMASQDRGYLSAALEYKRTMMAAAQEQTEASKKAIEKLTKEAMEQVGRASEKASEVIDRRIIRDEALWWLRLALTALPTILVLLLWACVGFTTLGT